VSKILEMDIFGNKLDQPINLIHNDGMVDYYGSLMTDSQADGYFDKLLESIAWQNDRAVIYGKQIITKRKVAWYGEKSFNYTYSNTTKKALAWTQELQDLKTMAEKKTNATYNSCLLNLYHNGTEGMAWHSDAEKDLKHNATICSLSFGADRKFSFKHKQSKEVVSLVLKHGSCLVMKGATQKNWLHRLPPTSIPTKARINLTFRTIDR
jgi:alkylated DNA repair dioxygenase AlkB